MIMAREQIPEAKQPWLSLTLKASTIGIPRLGWVGQVARYSRICSAFDFSAGAGDAELHSHSKPCAIVGLAAKAGSQGLKELRKHQVKATLPQGKAGMTVVFILRILLTYGL
jgi:hypothetical protein